MPQNEMSFLCTARDEAQAGLMAGILENAGIPYLIKHRGVGHIYGGASIFGVELHVPSSVFSQAKELLEAYASQTESEDEPDVF